MYHTSTYLPHLPHSTTTSSNRCSSQVAILTFAQLWPIHFDRMPPQTLLLPSLYALAPATSLPNLLAHLSLLSIHVEPYFLHDTIYTASISVLPGQPRSVRLRSVRRRSRSSAKGKARADGDDWDHSLVYLSNPLSGREYAEMSVRACLDVDVASTQSRKEIEGFIEALAMSCVLLRA